MVPKLVVDITDYLIQLQPFSSPNGVVETENDWKIIGKLFEAFAICYPEDYRLFAKGMDETKRMNAESKGFTKDKGLQHQSEMPEKFMDLIKVFYPLQKYDIKFTRRLIKELPILQAN